MTLEQVETAFSQICYDRDARLRPDNLRRGQFKAGWKAGAEGVRYKQDTLLRLTWHNLGYRLGAALGPQVVQDVEWAFTILAERYVERRS